MNMYDDQYFNEIDQQQQKLNGLINSNSSSNVQQK
jgi:hypothetical protein